MIPKAIDTLTLSELAKAHGVCIRPVLHRVLDTVTGKVQLVSTPCGATLESKCPPCARKNRALRMHQCREGWHLEEEPTTPTPEDEPDPQSETAQQQSSERRVRSTRRRQDAPDLPRLPIQQRTVGRAFTTPSGRTYRPSMFVTFTLPSYGRVGADGTPIDPATYDYRRAALDALHFPKLIDRVWQNLRRCTGYQVQYFAVVESQRRLAPHLHTAIRGAIPRDVLRQVAAATYHHVWWPAFDEVVYDQDRLPRWDGNQFVDPDNEQPLPTWEEALDALDADHEAKPVHTIRLGRQLDVQGIIADESDADRRVAYLTKYLGKALGEPIGEDAEFTPRQRAHADRLLEELRWLPCSPRCWNWLRYGVQPKHARLEMVPGRCPGKAHDSEHMGCGGRRVLVSRKWTGKTLTGHRADRAEVVRQTLMAAGMDSLEIDRLAANVTRPDGRPRFEWRLWNAYEDPVAVYRWVLGRNIAERLRWKAEYEAAKACANPATGPPRPPDSRPSLVGAEAGQG